MLRNKSYQLRWSICCIICYCSVTRRRATTLQELRLLLPNLHKHHKKKFWNKHMHSCGNHHAMKIMPHRYQYPRRHLRRCLHSPVCWPHNWCGNNASMNCIRHKKMSCMSSNNSWIHIQRFLPASATAATTTVPRRAVASWDLPWNPCCIRGLRREARGHRCPPPCGPWPIRLCHPGD